MKTRGLFSIGRRGDTGTRSQKTPISFYILPIIFLILGPLIYTKVRSESSVTEAALHLIPLTQDPSLDANGSWSPDGKEIVFQSRRKGEKEKKKAFSEEDEEDTKKEEKKKEKKKKEEKKKEEESELARDRDIWIMNADGSNPRQLTKSTADEYQPVFSPDGKKILYVSDERGSPDIWVMDRDGSNKTRLTRDKGIERDPAWSPDGKKIVYAALPLEADNFDLWIMDADGSNKIQLTQTPSNEITPAWSPDGKYIAFASDEGGNLDIYLIDPDGKNRTKLISTAGYEYQPDWSPDGSKIAYTAWGAEESLDQSNIWIANADGSQRIQLTSISPSAHPRWHPNGTQILFHSKRSGNWDLWVLQVPENILRVAQAAPSTPRRDNLILRNGDLISGKILNEKFTIALDGKMLEVPKSEIQKIEFIEGSQDQIKLTKQNGEVIQGTLTLPEVKIQMELGPTVEILRDKIKSIFFPK
jgi:Tol biopolymer transport system component